jgi:hypothetical protein
MVEVCPKCDSTEWWSTNSRPNGRDADAAYGCKCGARFEELVERERKSARGESRRGLARVLVEYDSGEDDD